MDFHYRPRAVEPMLRSRLAAFPVVVLTGARQTGKSTLAQHVGGRERTYLTLDDHGVLDQALREPATLVARGASRNRGVGDPATGHRLTLDEIQRAPDLLLAIKRAVDMDRSPGQFLLTGSANLDLMRQVSETLAGRAVYLTLWPMTRREVEGSGRTAAWDVLADNPPDQWLAALAGGESGDGGRGWEKLATTGGYPFPALHLEAQADREAWFEGYLQTYLERDLRQLAAIDNLIAFRRLARAVALRLGGLLNQASLARDAGIPPSTARRYLHLLEASYQLLRIEAYSVNRTKRLVKSPKAYWCDAGLALHMAAGAAPGGAHLENVVACDLFAWRETRPRRPNILFWRTSKGAQVDFVVETSTGLIPIEVKSSRTLRVAHARHLRTFLNEYRDQVPAGILIYAGREAHWLAERVLAVPWHLLL